MELLVLAAAALVISAVYGVITLAVLINFDVVPRPEPDELAARLDWHRSPRVRVLPSSRVASPALTNPSPGYVRTYAMAVMVVVPLAVGDVLPTMTSSATPPSIGATPVRTIDLPAAYLVAPTIAFAAPTVTA